MNLFWSTRESTPIIHSANKMQSIFSSNSLSRIAKLTELIDAKIIIAKPTINKSCPFRRPSHRAQRVNAHASPLQKIYNPPHNLPPPTTIGAEYANTTHINNQPDNASRPSSIHFNIYHTRFFVDSLLCTQIVARFLISYSSRHTSELNKQHLLKLLHLNQRPPSHNSVRSIWTLRSIHIMIIKAATYEDLENFEDTMTTWHATPTTRHTHAKPRHTNTQDANVALILHLLSCNFLLKIFKRFWANPILYHWPLYLDTCPKPTDRPHGHTTPTTLENVKDAG